MPQRHIPCLLMRGGTSRAPYFLAKDLPTDREALARVLIVLAELREHSCRRWAGST